MDTCLNVPTNKNGPAIGAVQIINKPQYILLGCMKGAQPLHFKSAGVGVYVAEEKIYEAELDPGPAGPSYAENDPLDHFPGASDPRVVNFHSSQIFWP